ncbi:17635_t:CDS:2 [Funneliformis geosporum]|uniref:15625_t:CDS:1 n=1 Tax=Funneliformis geosporum TaxID=1117311 RepID=A0A9W4SA51_9GLOM|nr:15625_t:CDS:2 [Funneliformis geosporum]CAI2161829.1 17635_t:CDS:2 [Funneliformis geosporum]
MPLACGSIAKSDQGHLFATGTFKVYGSYPFRTTNFYEAQPSTSSVSPRDSAKRFKVPRSCKKSTAFCLGRKASDVVQSRINLVGNSKSHWTYQRDICIKTSYRFSCEPKTQEYDTENLCIVKNLGWMNQNIENLCF